MYFERYSATKMFGIPFEDPKQLDSIGELTNLFAAYDIEPEQIPTNPTDITPYYWERPAFRYFASLAHPEGPLVVDLMPKYSDSKNFALGGVGSSTLPRAGVRRIEIPTDQETLVIAGPGPRFAGKICIHELITYNEGNG